MQYGWSIVEVVKEYMWFVYHQRLVGVNRIHDGAIDFELPWYI